jgi:hypothetical protein
MGEGEGIYVRGVGDAKGFGRVRGLLGRVEICWGLVRMYGLPLRRLGIAFVSGYVRRDGARKMVRN